MTKSPDDIYSEGLDAGLAKYIQDTGNLQPDTRLYYYAAAVAKKLMEEKHEVDIWDEAILIVQRRIHADNTADVNGAVKGIIEDLRASHQEPKP